MGDERRYDEGEVAAIFEAAAREGPQAGHAVAPREGFSLAELQAIGAEAGIAPARIADAAAALEVRGDAAPRRTHLGLPVGVGRTVDLPRAPTAEEWAQLVIELRLTFRAAGRDVSQGGLRAWMNGNLQVYVEPTGTGHRLRMGTVKGDAAGINGLGLAGMLAGAASLPLVLATGELGQLLALGGMAATAGAALLGMNVLRLPRWAREREAQMEHIARRARELLGAAPPPVLAAPEADGGA